MNIPQLETEKGHVKVGGYDPLTEAHGPGKRFALWVQGCSLMCPGCINQDMLPENGGSDMRVTQITSLIQRQVQSAFPIEGITFMGGEPMMQASAIADILAWCRENMDLNTILFSGYTLSVLRRSNDANIQRVLSMLDVLIDGRYIQERRSMDDIRGSNNQTIHHLKNSRLVDASFSRRTAEFMIDDGAAGNLSIVQSGFTPNQITNI